MKALKKMQEEQAETAKESKQTIGLELARLSQNVARLEAVTNSNWAEQKQGFSGNNKPWNEFLESRKEWTYARVVGILILLAILLILIFRFRQA